MNTRKRQRSDIRYLLKLASVAAVAGFMMLATFDCNASKHSSSVGGEVLSTARISVDTAAPAGDISDLIYGAAVEWTENGNRILDPQSGSLRDEMVSGLRPLRVPVWRFPGGILSDHYHWRDGIGPRSDRPKRRNPMDNSEHENNFGTDEFIALCRTLGAEALITVNRGSGSLRDALEWQRYFADKGVRVKYWEIGNEIYLAENSSRAAVPGNDKRIYKSPEDYAGSFGEWARGLRAAGPGVLVGAIAGTYNTSQQNRGWLDALVDKAGDEADFVALHNSFAPVILGSYDYTKQDNRIAAYRAMYAHTLSAADDVRKVRERFARKRKEPVRIAITEHFPLFGGGGSQRQMLMILDQSRTLASAVFTAGLLQMYMREGVWMANYNIATSKWFGALLTDTDQGVVRTPTWHVYDLYRNHFGKTLLKASVESPEYATDKLGMVQARKHVPFLDAIASRDGEGGIYLAVVNRHESRAIDAEIAIPGVGGTAEVWSVSGPAPEAINGSSLSNSTKAGGDMAARKSVWSGEGKYSFPPSSVTVLRWQLAKPAAAARGIEGKKGRPGTR